MIRLSPRVVLVGSGQHGFQMTNPLDCNVYLLDGGAECALIDAGSGVKPERILRNIEKIDGAVERLSKVILTHAHADHAAGSWFWKEKLGLEVQCAAEAAPWVAAGDVEKTSLRLAIAAGAYPAEYVFRPCEVDITMGEGDVLRVGEIELTVLETPGHSRGHVSLAFEEEGKTSCLTGDVVFTGGTIVLQNTWDCSIQEYAATMARLHEMRIDRLYPGHKVPLMTAAHTQIEKAHRVFEGLGVPPNFY